MELEHGKMTISLPTETWKSYQIDNETVTVEREGDLEIHGDWSIVSAYDEETLIVERSSIAHPSYAVHRKMKSFTSFVMQTNRNGTTLAVWPAMHTVAISSGLATIDSKYFPANGSKIITERVYERGKYFLPLVFKKSVYAHATDEKPSQVFVYRRVAIE